jgi:glycosyltransferase involved in cell wall biosynthesis
MAAFPSRIALLYDNDAYQETLQPLQKVVDGAPMGLMGRQVAGKDFLDAFLTHGRFAELAALVYNAASRESLTRLWETHPGGRARGRSLRVFRQARFHPEFLARPPAPVFHLPSPLDARYAWARQTRGHGFALCGVTHTLSTAEVAQVLCQLVTAPFEAYDALVCTSRAAVDFVRTAASTYAAYLRERHGGQPQLRVRLETIPLGVNTETFRPPTPAERAARRKALGITDEEVAVLFIGRLSFHAKANPYPTYAGIAHAARATGRKVHLIMSGWAANNHIRAAFEDGARVFAPGVRVSFVDSLDPDSRYSIWHVGDVFTTLSDNIQETFGLTLVQAQACGLPVVASDWNGYRDVVADGETGLLVPTYMIRDASGDATARLLLGEINYDVFLGTCSQTVAVDPAAAGQAYARLIGDAGLRQRMGAAARQRALDRFAWPGIIRAYEALWQSQDEERQAHAARSEGPQRTGLGPACFPAPEHAFAGYPTAVLPDETRLQAAENAQEKLEAFLGLTVANYVADSRPKDPAVFRAVLDAAATPRTIAELEDVLRAAGAERGRRATLVWLLKYGLVRITNTEANRE